VPDPYSWPLDDIVLVVPVLLTVYGLLVPRFRPSAGRPAAFVGANLLLLAAFATPVDTIALHYLLSVHLLQNVVVAEWAPGLAVLGLPPLLAADLESRSRPLRRLTNPFVALPLWLGTYVVWHVPAVYDFALRNAHSVLHLEHATYFLAGCLLWWPILHGRLSSGGRAAYVFAAFLLASPLGLLLSLLPRPVYDFYADGPGLWGLSPTTDQQIAGVTMAAEQALVFFAVFAFWFARFLAEQEDAEEDEPGASSALRAHSENEEPSVVK
jgi:cytochrome c oxidase assembly factor CtaG